MNDRGVLQPRGDASFALEASREVAMLGQQLLDRDIAPEPAIARGDNATHPALRDLVYDQVVLAVDREQLAVVTIRGSG